MRAKRAMKLIKTKNPEDHIKHHYCDTEIVAFVYRDLQKYDEELVILDEDGDDHHYDPGGPCIALEKVNPLVGVNGYKAWLEHWYEAVLSLEDGDITNKGDYYKIYCRYYCICLSPSNLGRLRKEVQSEQSKQWIKDGDLIWDRLKEHNEAKAV